MFINDISELVCPDCRSELAWREIEDCESDDVASGTLACTSCSKNYPVRNGIARFICDIKEYNATWNYKWNEIDRGRGLNYKIIEKSDPAYEIHDIYDRNSHNGRAFTRMRDGKAIEIGCGVGQYVIRSIKEYQPRKIVALDLTEAVDTFRSIVRSRYPEMMPKILFVQASVFAMPFRQESFDFVYSLGVLHHTGRTLDAIREASSLVRNGGDLNFWVYASSSYPVDARETGRRRLAGILPLLRIVYGRIYVRSIYWILGKIGARRADMILSFFASPAWFQFCKIPFLGRLGKFIIAPVNHPDPEYRRLNLFDGYVNLWAENWSEHEIFPVLRDAGIVVRGISTWRVGFWGTKKIDFYRD